MATVLPCGRPAITRQDDGASRSKLAARGVGVGARRGRGVPRPGRDRRGAGARYGPRRRGVDRRRLNRWRLAGVSRSTATRGRGSPVPPPLAGLRQRPRVLPPRAPTTRPAPLAFPTRAGVRGPFAGPLRRPFPALSAAAQRSGRHELGQPGGRFRHRLRLALTTAARPEGDHQAGGEERGQPPKVVPPNPCNESGARVASPPCHAARRRAAGPFRPCRRPGATG